jgi:cell division protein FtsZ
LAADESPEEIQELFLNHDFVLLVGGLGGGTATGAMPVIARAARKAGIAVLCLVTTPFPFEGERRRLAAEEGLRVLHQDADSVICLPNERLRDIVDANLPVEDAFRLPDELLASGVHSLWRLLTQTGVLNLNFADVRELFARSGGVCAYGHAEATGPARASAALQRLLDSPLLASGRKISEAEGLLVCVAGGTDLTLADVEGIMGRLHGMARPSAKIFLGAYVDPALRDRLAITVLVTENWLQDREGKVPARDTLHDLSLESVARATDTASGDGEPEQTEIPFEAASRGRFEKVEPTYYRGQDLDIPTYIRRGLKLSFET